MEAKGKVMDNLTFLVLSWKNLIKKVDPSISGEDANRLGKKLAESYKKKYDEWMKEYKTWAEKFFSRTRRRLILRI